MEIHNNGGWLNTLGWLASICAVSYFIRRVTKDFDEDLTPEFRIALGRQLMRVKDGDADWLYSFGNIFNGIFGAKHLSWRCFSRSMLFSGILFAFLTLSTGALTLNGAGLSILASQTPLLVSLFWILTLVVAGMTFNGILDYISLSITRLIIRLSLPSVVKILANVTLTTIVVHVIFAIVFGLIVYSGLTAALLIDNDQAGSSILLIFLLFGIQFMEFPPKFGNLAFVIFATSFSTSIWLALHLLSGVLIRWLPGAVSVLNAERAPVRAIGIVSIGVVWLLGLSGGAVALVYSWVTPGH